MARERAEGTQDETVTISHYRRILNFSPLGPSASAGRLTTVRASRWSPLPHSPRGSVRHWSETPAPRPRPHLGPQRTLESLPLSAAPAPATTFVRTQATGGPSSLAAGTVIGAASTYANSTATVVSATGVGSNGWVANSVNYFGFRFYNESTASVNYGYGAMQVGATGGVRTLLFLEYGNAGESVSVVPAPGALALVGLAGIAARRRRR